MTARRYTVRLYEGILRRGEDVAINLDPRDDRILRVTLERLVFKHRKTLDLDLSCWRIVVHSFGGGRIHAKVSVSPTGQTVVKR